MPGRRGTTRSPSGAFDTSLVATRVRVLSTEASRAHRVCGDIQLLTKVTRGVSPERNTAITVPVSGLSGGHRVATAHRLVKRGEVVPSLRCGGVGSQGATTGQR